MKKFAILFTILVALLLIAPGIIGYKTEGQYQEIISSIQESGLDISSSEYHRGWFGSRAETVFTLSLPQDLGVKDLSVTMQSDIVHGPLSPDGGIVLAAIATEFVYDGKPLFPDEENQVLNTRITISGQGECKIEIPALQLDAEPGRPKIEFSGADGKLNFNTDFSDLNINLEAADFRLDSGDGQSLKITNVTLSSDTSVVKSGIRFGNGWIDIGKIDYLDSKGGVSFKLDALNLVGDTKPEGENLGFTAKYTLKEILVNDLSYGPAELQLDLGNIPLEVAGKLQQGMQEIRQQKLNEQEQGMAVIGLLMGVGPDLLKANPWLAIKRLYLKTPEGEVEGNLNLSAVNLQWNEIGNMQAILKRLQADASMRIPETLLHSLFEKQAQQSVRQHIARRIQMGEEISMPSKNEIEIIGRNMVSERLNELIQQDLLKREGDHVSGNAKLGDGLLSVNGKTVPLL